MKRLLLVARRRSVLALRRSPPRPCRRSPPPRRRSSWRAEVARARARPQARLAVACKPARVVFYAQTDWLRLATKLAQTPSPCAQYFVSVPPLAADKTQARAGQAAQIRALGSSFHAARRDQLARLERVGRAPATAPGTTPASAARQRMAAAGFDAAAGDTWALNELSSAVRKRDRRRAPKRARLPPRARGRRRQGHRLRAAGIGQSTADPTPYKVNLQGWLQDGGVLDARQRLRRATGRRRTTATCAPTPSPARRPTAATRLDGAVPRARARACERGACRLSAAARSFLDSRPTSPSATPPWAWPSAYGLDGGTARDTMEDFVSGQVYAARSLGAPSGSTGSASRGRRTTRWVCSDADFNAQTGCDSRSHGRRDPRLGRARERRRPPCAPAWCTTSPRRRGIHDRVAGVLHVVADTAGLHERRRQRSPPARSARPITVQLQTRGSRYRTPTRRKPSRLATTSGTGGYLRRPVAADARLTHSGGLVVCVRLLRRHRRRHRPTRLGHARRAGAGSRDRDGAGRRAATRRDQALHRRRPRRPPSTPAPRSRHGPVVVPAPASAPSRLQRLGGAAYRPHRARPASWVGTSSSPPRSSPARCGRARPGADPGAPRGEDGRDSSRSDDRRRRILAQQRAGCRRGRYVATAAALRSASTASRTQQSGQVVVDDAACLHRGIDRRRADEPEAAPSASAFASAVDSGVEDCQSACVAGLVVLAARNDQKSSCSGVASRSATVARAFAIAASILPRWRTIAASASSRSTSRSPKRATRSGRSPRTRRGSPRACAGSSATRAPTGSPRGRAARRGRARRGRAGPTPRRGRRCRAGRSSPSSGRLDVRRPRPDDPVLDRDGVRRDRLVRRQRQRDARLEVERRAVARADHAAHVLLPLALAERPVVVRAAVLERVELAVAVVDADRRPAERDDLRRAGPELVERRDVDLRHGSASSSRSSPMPRHSSGSGVPFARCSATFSTPSPRIAHLSRIGVSGIPISSSSSSFGSTATSAALRPFTSSVSIDVAACEIAQPRPSKPTLLDRLAVVAERDGDRDLVAAERVLALGLRVGVLEQRRGRAGSCSGRG